MIVKYGELDLNKLDNALIYESQFYGALRIVDRRLCPLCSRTIAFTNMAGGQFVTFNQAHLPCVRKHYDRTGNIPEGFTVMNDNRSMGGT